MQIVNKLIRLLLAVNDMPKAKEFYAEKLGLKVEADYRRDDHNWWVTLALPEGGPTIVLSTLHEHLKPGTMSLYFACSDIAASHQEMTAKGVAVNDIKDNLYGPGSGVKWFSLKDPDGNQVFLVQA